MAIESKKKDRIWVSYKEAAAFTADTDEFTEMRSSTMTFPEPTWMRENDKDKLGSGQFGTRTELQSTVTPFSITSQRLSEVAWLMSYALGTADAADQIGATTAYKHQLEPLAVNSLTLPTFTFEYGTGSSNVVQTGNIINDFSLTLSMDDNGVIDFSANGWGARHRDNSGTIATRTAGSMSTGEQSFIAEPLINAKSCKLWIADSMPTNVRDGSLSFVGPDVATYTDISSLLNSITFTYTNSKDAASAARGGGGGVPSDNTRGAAEMTLELNLRKDSSTVNLASLNLADTSKALELSFNGPEISSTLPYAMNLFWPLVQVVNEPEDDETPISQTVTFDVFEDTGNKGFLAFFQTLLTLGYNAAK